jgi:hypothetical protein
LAAAPASCSFVLVLVLVIVLVLVLVLDMLSDFLFNLYLPQFSFNIFLSARKYAIYCLTGWRLQQNQCSAGEVH